MSCSTAPLRSSLASSTATRKRVSASSHANIARHRIGYGHRSQTLFVRDEAIFAMLAAKKCNRDDVSRSRRCRIALADVTPLCSTQRR